MQPDTEAAEREFAIQMMPLLKQKCLACHVTDAADIKGEYSMLHRDSLLQGGESGDVAVVDGRFKQLNQFGGEVIRELIA